MTIDGPDVTKDRDVNAVVKRTNCSLRICGRDFTMLPHKTFLHFPNFTTQLREHQLQLHLPNYLNLTIILFFRWAAVKSVQSGRTVLKYDNTVKSSPAKKRVVYPYIRTCFIWLYFVFFSQFKFFNLIKL